MRHALRVQYHLPIALSAANVLLAGLPVCKGMLVKIVARVTLHPKVLLSVPSVQQALNLLLMGASVSLVGKENIPRQALASAAAARNQCDSFDSFFFAILCVFIWRHSVIG